MALTTCPDCGRQVSTAAATCPQCGRPFAPPIATGSRSSPPSQIVDRGGVWCPHCKNRDSVKRASGTGCVFWIFVIVSMGLALIMIPFLPKTWHCNVCGNEWKA
jgi:uncharacterized membrane protein YvbJ